MPLEQVRRKRRRGVATLELAVCLPALMVLVFASIEACSMIFLNQSLTVAAYEGARLAIQPTSTEAAVRARCGEVLTARRVTGAVVSILPGDPATAEAGEVITVSVVAPCSANSVMPDWFFAGKQISASTVMVKE